MLCVMEVYDTYQTCSDINFIDVKYKQKNLDKILPDGVCLDDQYRSNKMECFSYKVGCGICVGWLWLYA